MALLDWTLQQWRVNEFFFLLNGNNCNEICLVSFHVARKWKIGEIDAGKFGIPNLFLSNEQSFWQPTICWCICYDWWWTSTKTVFWINDRFEYRMYQVWNVFVSSCNRFQFIVWYYLQEFRNGKSFLAMRLRKICWETIKKKHLSQTDFLLR